MFKVLNLLFRYIEYKSKGVCIMNEKILDESAPEVFLDLNNGEYLQFNMTIPIQILFDDVMNFVSKTDFDD